MTPQVAAYQQILNLLPAIGGSHLGDAVERRFFVQLSTI